MATPHASNASLNHEVDEELLRPLRIASFIAKRPCAMYWCSLITVLLMTIIDGTVFSLDIEGDDRTLFVEVEGEEEAINAATEKLYSLGYLAENKREEKIILIEFKLPEKTGTL